MHKNQNIEYKQSWHRDYLKWKNEYAEKNNITLFWE